VENNEAETARKKASAQMVRFNTAFIIMAMVSAVGGFSPSLQAFRRVKSGARAGAVTAEMPPAMLAALNRVSDRRGEVVVVKYGGHAMTNDERAAEFASDVALLQSLGLRPVVVHGGGPQINEMLERLEVKSNFVNGLRVTSPEVMEVVEMVLCGKLNKKIAAAINAAGGRAVGLSGKDDAIVTATQKNPELGLVGKIENVSASLLQLMLDAGVVPVIAPVATGEGGLSYNVNADTMAGAIAGALNAADLLLLTDVAGVFDGPPDDGGKLIENLTPAQSDKLIEDGIATGGMIPKLGTACEAVFAGAGTAVIMDGRVPHCALEFLFGDTPIGTAVSEGA
jgi:acetylglutamate kinase